MNTRVLAPGLMLMISIVLPAPAAAAGTGTGTPTAHQIAGHLVAARATLPVSRQRQLDAVESAIDSAAKAGVPNVDAITAQIVGAVPSKQLLSFEAMALSDLVSKREADVASSAGALADALNRRSTAVAQLSRAKVAGQPTDTLQGQVDSLSDLSESAQLQLQMAMDRMSKFIETLSNILKKIDDTDSGIVQNLK